LPLLSIGFHFIPPGCGQDSDGLHALALIGQLQPPQYGSLITGISSSRSQALHIDSLRTTALWIFAGCRIVLLSQPVTIDFSLPNGFIRTEF
jgi:hypothetical protein